MSMLEVTLNIYMLMATIFLPMALGFILGRTFERKIQIFSRLKNMDEDEMKELIEKWGE